MIIQFEVVYADENERTKMVREMRAGVRHKPQRWFLFQENWRAEVAVVSTWHPLLPMLRLWQLFRSASGSAAPCIENVHTN